ncbi:AAA family ATPase [Gordonia insulae]|uniref:Trifunctional NAD biosynthesis/regulator protein NadR n=1 Tax=Gordonia insulae TaxID=2420509 RepID=A0A3G8JMZ9_9ACTN|nr:AAA family ATPase [Gordonia insulae]AZG46454.1 Trifunctional NAD biosynthesis/regulator protein NadR [Gordonia insulae]
MPDPTTDSRADVRFRHALVLGKFYPLHIGHDHLIRSAIRSADSVTVQVIGSVVESIPVATRETWVREVHPTVRVVSAVDETPIDFDSPELWDAHVRVISGLLDEPVDAVFTGDGYGAELARRLDATWVPVDRMLNPVSGTAVRDDLVGRWHDLSATVRGDLARRIVILGAESTGTTTLARALADAMSTAWVPEYGREYSVTRPGGPRAPWRSDEFDLIVERQLRAERAAARRSPTPVVICDTDVLATGVWHERYLGFTSPSVTAAAADHRPLHYILTGDEIPFVDDGTRDGELLRHSMQRRFRQVLGAQTTPWIEVTGSVTQRLAALTPVIDAALREALTFSEPLEKQIAGRLHFTDGGIIDDAR